MALGIGLLTAQLVGGIEELGEIGPPLQRGEVSLRLLQVFFQIGAGQTHRLAGDEGLPGAGGRARVGGQLRIAAHVAQLLPGQAQGLGHDLEKDRGAALPDVGGRRIELHHAPPDHQFGPPFVRKAHPHAGILHRAGDSGAVPVLLIDIPDGQQRLPEGGGGVGDLPVGEGFARLDGVAVADLPGGEPRLFGQKVDAALQGEGALTHAEAPKGPGGRIVGIVAVPPDVGILIAVGPHRVGAGPLQHRTAQRGIGPGVKVDLAVQAGKHPVGIAA